MQFLCLEKTKLKIIDKWNWGDHVLSIVSNVNYTYLGVDFSYNGAWDTHIKKLIQNGKQKVNQLNSISNRYINLSARRMLLLSVLRPSLEYGSEVWKINKSQAASLESKVVNMPLSRYPKQLFQEEWNIKPRPGRQR